LYKYLYETSFICYNDIYVKFDSGNFSLKKTITLAMSSINQISEACSPYSQNLGAPTIKFAEDNVCGYIAQPANTWSNVAFLMTALLIAVELKRAKNKTVLWGFVPVYLFMGFTSGFYHASATFVGQFFDFGSIYLFAAFIVFLAIDRLKIFETKKLLWALSGVTILMFVLLWFVPILRIWLFAVKIVVFLWVELGLAKSKKPTFGRPRLSEGSGQSITTPKTTSSPLERGTFGYLYYALGIFLLAWGFWWLDYLYIWKDEATMHFINGHAIWHVLSAVSLYFVYRFYNQLEPKKS
jgi:hypothetical protein